VTDATAQRASVGPAVLPLCLVAVIVCATAGAAAGIAGSDFVDSVRSVSVKLRDSEISTSMMAVGALAVVLLVCLTGWLFVRRHAWFLVVLILSFALSEIQLSELNYVSLFLRYVCMLILVAGGLLRFFRSPGSLGVVQLLGLLLFAWMVESCQMSGWSAQATTLLPVHCAMFLGVLVGMQERYRDPREIARLNGALVLAGVLLTVLHLTSLLLATKSFVAGRFASYYVLPTNFANSYVVVVVAMLWYAMNAGKVLRRSAVGICALAGLVLIALSGTRNALAVAAICALCFALTVRARAVYLVVLAVVLMSVAGIYLMGDVHGLVALAGRASNVSLANRADVWTLAWQEITARPLIGHGLGITTALLGSKVEAWQQATYINAHNAYLGIWLQLGAIGLAILVCIYLWTLVRGAVLCVALGGPRATAAPVLLPAVLVLGLAAAGIAEENLSGRGSLQQIVWALCVAAVNGAYLSGIARQPAKAAAGQPIARATSLP
jgi:O-antigen ligase